MGPHTRIPLSEAGVNQDANGQSSLQRHDIRQQQRPSTGWVTLRLLLRLVVTGVGVAVLTGTLLHHYRPATGNAVTFSCLPC